MPGTITASDSKPRPSENDSNWRTLSKNNSSFSVRNSKHIVITNTPMDSNEIDLAIQRVNNQRQNLSQRANPKRFVAFRLTENDKPESQSRHNNSMAEGCEGPSTQLN